jgi:hypothetical protein
MSFDLKNRKRVLMRELPTVISHRTFNRLKDDIIEYEDWFEGFDKQQQFKQKFTVVDSEALVKKLKKDFDFAKSKNPNFCDGFIEGFREGYLHRGKEILGQ